MKLRIVAKDFILLGRRQISQALKKTCSVLMLISSDAGSPPRSILTDYARWATLRKTAATRPEAGR